MRANIGNMTMEQVKQEFGIYIGWIKRTDTIYFVFA